MLGVGYWGLLHFVRNENLRFVEKEIASSLHSSQSKIKQTPPLFFSKRGGWGVSFFLTAEFPEPFDDDLEVVADLVIPGIHNIQPDACFR